MDRIAELLCGFFARYKRAQIGVIRSIAVSAPVAFEFTTVRIQNSYALVAITVGNIRFIGCRIERDFGDAAEVLPAVAVSF